VLREDNTSALACPVEPGIRGTLSKGKRTKREIRKMLPLGHSARSHRIAALQIGAGGGLRHHRGIAKE
jgi:hypothetical protein